MEVWRADLFSELNYIQCENKLFLAIAESAKDLGFDYCAYGVRVPIPIADPRTEMFNNYPEGWQARYREMNYIAIDPTVLHCRSSIRPIIWSDENSAATRNFWEEANSYGLKYGWAQSCHDSNGVAGMLTLARSTEKLTEAELYRKGLMMIWLTQSAHLNMTRLLMKKLLPIKTEVYLSDREKSVLRWTAEGKTSSEISDILNISERTVNFHINNASYKLEAPNKTVATIHAALLGMI